MDMFWQYYQENQSVSQSVSQSVVSWLVSRSVGQSEKCRAIPEKNQARGGNVFENPHGIFIFLTLSTGILDKTKFHPLETPQNCVTPLGNFKT